MIVAEFGTRGGVHWRRVDIDPSSGAISFYNCHFPNRFFSWGVEPQYTCEISQVRGICWSRRFCGTLGRSELVLEVVTPAGRAMLPRVATGFDAMHAALMEGLPADATLRWYQYPIAQSLLLIAVIFPVGIATALATLTLWERQLISPAVLGGVFLVLISVAFLHRIAHWFGKPTIW